MSTWCGIKVNGYDKIAVFTSDGYPDIVLEILRGYKSLEELYIDIIDMADTVANYEYEYDLDYLYIVKDIKDGKIIVEIISEGVEWCNECIEDIVENLKEKNINIEILEVKDKKLVVAI